MQINLFKNKPYGIRFSVLLRGPGEARIPPPSSSPFQVLKAESRLKQIMIFLTQLISHFTCSSPRCCYGLPRVKKEYSSTIQVPV